MVLVATSSSFDIVEVPTLTRAGQSPLDIGSLLPVDRASEADHHLMTRFLRVYKGKIFLLVSPP
jgi:hypothetical protein